MSLSALTGTRLRERRLTAGLRQANGAVAAGISASCLNLIEHNRRRVAGQVLARLAAALGLDGAVFAVGREAALLDDLRGAAGSGQSDSELNRLKDFVGRFPGWASLLAAVHSRATQKVWALEALNDRMMHGPHLV